MSHHSSKKYDSKLHTTFGHVETSQSRPYIQEIEYIPLEQVSSFPIQIFSVAKGLLR